MKSKKRILVCEDEALVRLLLYEVLKHRYDVSRAADGHEALIKINKEGFDLILLDLKMPRVDGFQVLEYLGQKCPGIPVIICSNYSRTNEPRLEGKVISAFLDKPIDIDLLKKTVDRIINNQD
jgi:CheY-like chemotaxis protein